MSDGYLYVLSYPGSNLLKIGHTKDVPRRMSQLGTATPSPPIIEKLYVVDASKREALERRVHALAAPCRIRGEWFRLDVSSAEHFIEDAATRMGIPWTA